MNSLGLSLTSVRIPFLLAVLTLVGCGYSGSQQRFAPSTSAGQIANLSATGLSTGKKHMGQYWWIWLKVNIPFEKTRTIDVYCPKNYVVTGGGFDQGNEENTYTYASAPILPALTGWAVIAQHVNDPSGSGWETAYAVCAPAS